MSSAVVRSMTAVMRPERTRSSMAAPGPTAWNTATSKPRFSRKATQRRTAGFVLP